MLKRTIFEKNKKAIIAVGIGAAGAGAYFFYGKRGAKNRRKVKTWALQAKAEVLHALEGAKKFDWKSYQQQIERVLRRYRKVPGVRSQDLAKLMHELKGYWQEISRAADGAGKIARAKAR